MLLGDNVRAFGIDRLLCRTVLGFMLLSFSCYDIRYLEMARIYKAQRDYNQRQRYH